MDKFPELRTSRLVLGKLSIQDVPLIVEYAGNKSIADSTLNIPHPYCEDDAIFWLNSSYLGFKNKTQFTFGIKLKGEFIGGIGLKINSRFEHAEIGYWIAKPYWNLGLASESLEAILDFGFNQLNLNKIYATHIIENPASGKVMMKNGMVKEGELKDHAKKDGVFKSLIQYRITKEEFDYRNSI